MAVKIEITLHHDRNMKSFKRVFPEAVFEGFESGYFCPSFTMDKDIWKARKSSLPKSCTIDNVRTIDF
jgi:hypothetical protein